MEYKGGGREYIGVRGSVVECGGSEWEVWGIQRDWVLSMRMEERKARAMNKRPGTEDSTAVWP